MAVPSSLYDLSTTAANNSPAGTESIGTSMDDYLRAIQSIIKQNDSRGSDIASASTIAIPNSGKYFVVTGTTTINTISDSWTGRTVFLKFSGSLTITNSSGIVIPGGANIVTSAGDCLAATNESSGVWRITLFQQGSSLTDGGSNVQSQTNTAFTSAGTAPSFTITTSPAYGAYAANQRMRVKFHAASAGSDTLNRDGLGAKNIKQYDSAGAKVAPVIVANMLCDVEYDGTDMVILDPLPAVVPPGTIIDFGGNSAPSGYIQCNGAAVSRTTYAALFAAIGTLWGAGDGSTTFNIPNFPTGYAAVQGGTVGGTTVGQIPAHTHPMIGYATGANSGTGASSFSSGGTSQGNSGSAGSGTDNLAAGKNVLKCIKY